MKLFNHKDSLVKPERRDNPVNMDRWKLREDAERFTMMVRSVTEEDTRFKLTGIVHGAVRNGEAVTVLLQSGRTCHPLIEAIEVNGKDAAEAKDTQASLVFSGADPKDFNWNFAVVTNIPYQAAADVKKAAENPYLRGLLFEYTEYRSDNTYFNLLIREAVRAHYITPVYFRNAPEKKEDGSVVLKKDTTFAIPRLSNPEGSQAMPVFTDWEALNRWKEAFRDGKRETMMLRFPDVVTISKTDAGIVINPFGPVPYFLNQDMIKAITSSEGYKHDTDPAKVQEKTVQKGQKIMVGIPAESEEVTAIRERLADFGREHEEVRKLDLMLKTDADGSRAYLVVVDAEVSDYEPVFAEIYKTCRECLRAVTYMDFIPAERASFAKDILKDQKPAYMR